MPQPDVTTLISISYDTFTVIATVMFIYYRVKCVGVSLTLTLALTMTMTLTMTLTLTLTHQTVGSSTHVQCVEGVDRYSPVCEGSILNLTFNVNFKGHTW